MLQGKIGFIGAGKIVEVILQALGPFIGYKNIIIWNRTTARAETLAREFEASVAPSIASLTESCETIFLAVKPHAISAVLSEASKHFHPNTVLVSMAAGVSTDHIASYFSNPPQIIRIMPNLPMSVGLGMTAVCAAAQVSKDIVEEIVKLFGHAGRVSIVEERLFDVVTALSGSGPAFAFLFIESLADGAVLNGMSRQQAYEFAAQTVLGAAKIILDSDLHPGQLKDIVASPAGTTMSGIHVLEKKAFRAIVMDAVDAAARRSKELNT
jgi:pyrroline-5-carboxylate reductase